MKTTPYPSGLGRLRRPFCLLLAAAFVAVPARPAPASLAETVAGTETLSGLMTFHRGPDKLWLELPAALVDAPLGYAAVRASGAGDFAPRGSEIETQLVTWRRLGDHLVLRKENLDFRAAPGSPEEVAVRAAFPASPVFSARLVPLADDPETLLIDAGALFGPELAAILPERPGATPEDTILVALKVFADNVVARVQYRFRRQTSDEPPAGDRFARFRGPGRLPDPRTFAVTVDHNFFRLPADDGFRPRFADPRIGGMSFAYKDYTDGIERATAMRHVLLRWDVRQATLSPPVEPITFYLDRSVPPAWRPLVREGVRWWNTAFAKIGIPDAIEVRDPPDDPDWDPADLRYSVISWALADNLMYSGMAGPMFSDPRTGKVLKANVYLNAEFLAFARHRYQVYAWQAPEWARGLWELRRRRERGFCDRALSFSSQLAFARLVLRSRGLLVPGTPEEDRFAREAFLEVVAHEVGHALGFPHNWKASLATPWKEVAAGWATGHPETRPIATSVMDYDPINLAPRGEPQGDYFLKGVGIWDDLAIEYFYRPFPDLSPAEEAQALDAIAARGEIAPGLIYDGELTPIDPTSNSDDIGDDPLAFAGSRLRMIHEEVLPYLPELVLGEGHDYPQLRAALDAGIFSVAMDYVDVVARHVGGQITRHRVASSPAAPPGGEPPLRPVPAADQRRALAVLDRWVFAPGAFSLPPETLALVAADLLYDWNYPERYASDYDLGRRIAGLYDFALGTLLEPARLARVLDNERRVAAGADRFTLPELFAHLEKTAFGELEPPAAGRRFGAEAPLLGADRRALQRLLVDRLAGLVLAPEEGTPAEASQIAALTLRSVGRTVGGVLEAAPEGALDGYSGAHLEDLAARIDGVLEAGRRLPFGS